MTSSTTMGMSADLKGPFKETGGSVLAQLCT